MGDQLGTTVPSGARAQTRGVVFVHSCPRALAAHVEWALGDELGPPFNRGRGGPGPCPASSRRWDAPAGCIPPRPGL